MEPETRDGSQPPSGIRPQALMLTFLGIYVLDRDIAVSSASFIEVFARLGVSEQATRSTLSRMARRGLLLRSRAGQRVYFGLTTKAAEVLTEGLERITGSGPVRRDWDGHWTLLGFSLPESRRADRHSLRSRLRWSGFGSLQNGLWLAPSRVPVNGVLDDLELDGHVRAFVGQAVSPTDVDRMVREAYDLTGLAARYRSFLGRWDRESPLPGARDDLARRLWLQTEWLLLLRDDPCLPLAHLPADWPAVRAEKVFRRQDSAYASRAEAIADTFVDAIPLPPPKP